MATPPKITPPKLQTFGASKAFKISPIFSGPCIHPSEPANTPAFAQWMEIASTDRCLYPIS